MAKKLCQRTVKNKNRSRPKKSPAERRRRERTQLRRLIALGVPAETAAHLTPMAVRRLLRRPAKVKAKLAAASGG